MQVVRRVDVPVRDVKWSESGTLLAIISDASFYLLRYDQATVDAWFDSEREVDEDGIEDAFELITEVSERVRTGLHLMSCPSRLPIDALLVNFLCPSLLTFTTAQKVEFLPQCRLSRWSRVFFAEGRHKERRYALSACSLVLCWPITTRSLTFRACTSRALQDLQAS